MKFKVGDRVRVYCVNLGSSATSFVGTVEGFNPTGALFVKGDAYPDLKNSEVHPKQCRLLKKKPLRRMFLPKYLLPKIDSQTAEYPFVEVESAGFQEDYHYDDCIEFVEVRKSKTGSGK